ncbi:radical SAM family heme chaperone HemW [Ethanoligenens harbinense]|uniref:Heme chaperone HemW n=1 Tax=Ethanoligenens harbinense (strain DSM 18485 / JCM 12961 / CGMCC 1.5033 / YUAN-3) TaxID=663278 RepID=E6U8T5_ETHHY|nr:radical SAM family heme chaperone HemW [Ethanoligenens harbinense]ADU27170.1 oxygen-independent coproporphyrinogen III oxidase [Ethanoligenens harbinense YUAN-3]AVQ96239.1 coproporphyrinogen III oxidase family protein [Ethanoligenens harbinense YUAN-3]AYF38899.1 coproporphyrinogen III oxidase family protein [Ethanoligenens harbinense]AYF41649.1 coproporphyrinogen III oxidase family protein [Ethanoligenens harbinense]QCN92480.1 coproporphyrinogen III oxidase family protein [Ethanoligenens ha
MSASLGLYVHVPFCAPAKCPYCDFYSVPFAPEVATQYADVLRAAARTYVPRLAGRRVESVYFGGGTPVLLGGTLAALLTYFKQIYPVAPDAEITVEANPGSDLAELLPVLRAAGFNRLSLGMQSACDAELAALGRRHKTADVARAVEAARKAGFANLSLDLMLATPGQTPESIRRSVAFAAAQGVEHVSAYLLKVEPGTAFAMRGQQEADTDLQADCYLAACDALEARGYAQYEISNFARPGFASRHNLRYWDCGEYLGLGPGAHGFLDGRRFHYARDLAAFLTGRPPEGDGPGGGFEEYVMLRLRLADGVEKNALRARCGANFSAFDAKTVERLENGGFLRRGAGRIALTRQGFLVSNAVIGALLFP